MPDVKLMLVEILQPGPHRDTLVAAAVVTMVGVAWSIATYRYRRELAGLLGSIRRLGGSRSESFEPVELIDATKAAERSSQVRESSRIDEALAKVAIEIRRATDRGEFRCTVCVRQFRLDDGEFKALDAKLSAMGFTMARTTLLGASRRENERHKRTLAIHWHWPIRRTNDDRNAKQEA